MINYCDLILTYNLMLCTYLVSLQAFQVYQRDLTPNKEREREREKSIINHKPITCINVFKYKNKITSASFGLT